MTLLSIVIANYNNGHLLKECVSSILKDSHSQDFEILIIDDKSTDNSLEIIQKLTKLAPIRFHFLEKNGGVESVFNAALKLAKGEYLHFFAADDRYLPGALSTMLAHIKLSPEAPLFSSDYASFLPSQIHQMQQKKILPLQSFRFFSADEVFFLFRHTAFWLPGHTVFVKKSAYLPYAPQDKNLRSISDWYIYHKMALDGGVGYLPHPLIARREDPNSNSASLTSQEKKAMWHYLLTLLERTPHEKLAQSGILRMLGLKAIFTDLITQSRYWKYLPPLLTKELEKKCFSFLHLNPEKFWLRHL